MEVAICFKPFGFLLRLFAQRWHNGSTVWVIPIQILAKSHLF